MGGLYGIFLVIIFHKITASFLGVAVTAVALAFLYATLLKKSDRWVSLKLPIALATWRKAILSLLLPLGILLLSILHPDILLLGANLSHEVNWFDDGNFGNPYGPTSS